MSKTLKVSFADRVAKALEGGAGGSGTVYSPYPGHPKPKEVWEVGSSTFGCMDKFDQLTFEDLITAVEKIDPNPNPIEEIKLGSTLFTQMNKKLLPPYLEKDKPIISTLYGIIIREDKTLKPNQYRIVRHADCRCQIFSDRRRGHSAN